MSKHEGLRFACDLCDYKAVRFSTLKRHTESVHDGTKYLCKYCSYQTSHTQEFKKHMNDCHKSIKEEVFDTQTYNTK